MLSLKRFRLKFWKDKKDALGPYRYLFNFRLLWKQTVIISVAIALFPLILFTLFDYNVTEQAVESESLLRTSRFVSNTRRTVSFFLAERRFALDFVIHDNSYEYLSTFERLKKVLQNLKRLGGFVDLGIIDASGIQQLYVGPFELHGADYSQQSWFKEILDKGVYISDVFMGLRELPHMVIAVKHPLPNNSFYVLRASLKIEIFNEMLAQLQKNGVGDAFLINQQGVLQTPSRYFGDILQKVPMDIPEFSEHTKVFITKSVVKGENIVIGYAYIKNSPFVLMLVNKKDELMRHWYMTRFRLLVFLGFTIMIILLVILSTVTYLVNAIHIADQKRLQTLHNIEYSDKMATIGRLAAGVAHEINNPLAIINEKAGLIQDMFHFSDKYNKDKKLLGLADSIILSVERCSAITRRLLNFARQSDITMVCIDLKKLIDDVVSFLGKEPEYRSITISVDVKENIIGFESDRGRLQQILLNITKNALAALQDGGHISIKAELSESDSVNLYVQDNGCGIPQADLTNIFDPFFTTKASRGGTGLGLSITYSLVKELGGNISVSSQPNEGSCFSINLPLKPLKINKEEKKDDENTTC